MDADSDQFLIQKKSLPGLRMDLATGQGGTDINEDRVEALFRMHEAQLGRFLAQILSSRWLAEDLLQETFVTAVRRRDQLADVSNPEAWLFAIARNHALHSMRSRRRRLRAMERLKREPAAVQPDLGEAIAVRDHLEKHLRTEDRVLLVLRYVHGFDSNELAQIVGRSSDAVRQQLSRARRQLVASLRDDQVAPGLEQSENETESNSSEENADDQER